MRSIWKGVWRSICRLETGIQGHVDILIGQGKLLLGHMRMLHSIPLENFGDPNIFVRFGTLAAAQANLCLARAISITSVSGPSYRVSGYHIDYCLSVPCQVFGDNSQKALMDVFGSGLALTDCSISYLTSRHAQPGVAGFHSFTTYGESTLENCSKASMRLRNKEQPTNFSLYGYFIYNVSKREGSANPFLGFDFEHSHISSPAYSSTGTAPDVPFDNSKKEDQHSSSAD